MKINVNTGECLLLVLSYITRHHLTIEALKDLLILLNVLFPNSIPSTKHMFFKALDTGVFQVIMLCNLLSNTLNKSLPW